MSAKTEYKCDLCWEIVDKSDLMCLFWDSTAKNDVGGFGAYMLVANLKLADKHICSRCIKIIKDANI